MMNNELKEAINAIAPTSEQKSRMLSGIKQRTVYARGNVRWLRVTAVAAALCCLFGMTAFADDIGEMFTGLFTKDAVIGETVLTGVYSDTDGHVQMAVEELLSDGMTVRMVVRYRAVDEKGTEWLNELECLEDGKVKFDQYGFFAAPAFKDNNTVLYGVNWSHGARELEEYNTETERIFVVIMEADRIGWGTEDIELSYLMPSGERTTLLDASARVEMLSYELDSSAAPEKLYVPESAAISPISLVINGTDLGVTESGEENGYYYSRMVAEAEIDWLFLCFKDGTRIDLLRDDDHFTNGAWMLGGGNASDGENSLIIASISFTNPIDVSAVAGIELDGVFYPFE